MKPIRYLSVCSGIEAASVAWSGVRRCSSCGEIDCDVMSIGHAPGKRCACGGELGSCFSPVAFSEIEPAACRVLAHHYPEVPNLGDMTRISNEALRELGPVDLLVGGTPCQSFSVAGLRKGLADPRGNLALEFLRLVDATRPRWVVWENVPGVLSSVSNDAPDPSPPAGRVGLGDGDEVVVEDQHDATEAHALGCFVAGLQELGFGVCWRVLDAQYFGLAQRRKRVFVVGRAGDWRGSAAVLLERESLSGNPPPSRKTRSRSSAPLAAGSSRGSGYRNDADTAADNLVPEPLNGPGEGVSHAISAGAGGSKLGSGRDGQDTFVAIPIDGAGKCGGKERDPKVGIGIGSNGDPAYALGSDSRQAVAHSLRGEGADASEDGTGRGVPIVYQCHGSNVGKMGALRAGNGSMTSGVPFVAVPLSGGSSPNSNAPGSHKEGDTSLVAEDHSRRRSAQGADRSGSCEEGSSSLLRKGPKIQGSTPGGPPEPCSAPTPGFINPRKARNSESSNQVGIKPEADVSDALSTDGPGAILAPMAFAQNQREEVRDLGDVASTVKPPGTHAQTFIASPPEAFRKSRRAQSSEDDETWVSDGKGNTLNGFDIGERDTHAVIAPKPEGAIGFHTTQDPISGEMAPCMGAGNSIGVAAPALTASNDPSRSPQSSEVTAQVEAVERSGFGVRRLTVTECERLQGFPDGYTAVPGKDGSTIADSPRYKMLGNSMATTVMRWIGRRIVLVDQIMAKHLVSESPGNPPEVGAKPPRGRGKKT